MWILRKYKWKIAGERERASGSYWALDSKSNFSVRRNPLFVWIANTHMFDSQMFAANPKDRQIGFDKTSERYMQNGLNSHQFPYNVCDGARTFGAHIRLPADCAR